MNLLAAVLLAIEHRKRIRRRSRHHRSQTHDWIRIPTEKNWYMPPLLVEDFVAIDWELEK